MKYVDFILFDLDGTLVDSKKDIAKAVNFTLKEIGFKEKSDSEISSYIGRGVGNLISKSTGTKQDVFLKRALSIFEEYHRKHCTDNSVLYPNVKKILEYFKDKKKIIVTNRNYDLALPVLKTLGIYNYFEDIIGGDDIGCMKPSSCPLDKTIYRFDISKEKAIMVGDMDIDVLAGKRAGIITCAVTYGIGKKKDIVKTKPDFIINDIIKLKNIIC